MGIIVCRDLSALNMHICMYLIFMRAPDEAWATSMHNYQLYGNSHGTSRTFLRLRRGVFAPLTHVKL